ncbi:unnamed protein product (macronuclear) [Paramecium tetraurelia]|uniref:Uncharacterized protein n=1 Tax=Paramecium tetraurelia TaxID=5888 RepID=A0CFX9_PARTE|nr:uncharacterized protein GSPATT00038138001 [Paramecium tetraurelia]CAK69696.1 unnamed protein product [Paramecium tetraurelia]|eukprot:XP_001437093.1 hypothetical protein (macronuclear) [Paramecium tetraurelia strain d4-2]
MQQQQQETQAQNPQIQQKIHNKSNHDSIEDQKYSHEKMEESSIYQDFANFAKATNYKQSSPYNYHKQQFQQIPQLNQNSGSNNTQEIKDLQLKNKSLLQQNSILQQSLLDLQQAIHRQTIDLDLQKNEILNQKRVVQEQQIEIEQLKRQLSEKRNSSLEKTRQFAIIQTQLIQSNQMVEKLISQLMNQESQLSLYRQTQINFPKIDNLQLNVDQNKSNLINAQNLLSNPSSVAQPYSAQYQQQSQSQMPHNTTQQQQQQQSQQSYQIQQQQIQISQQQQNPNPVSMPTKQQLQQDADTSYERYLMHKRGRH